MAWKTDRQCPTCGNREHRAIQVVTVNAMQRQVAETMFICTACGTLFDPQYIEKIGWLGRFIRWLSK